MLTTITNWIIFAAANLYNTLMGIKVLLINCLLSLGIDRKSQQDILLSVNSGSGISEARVEKGLPFRIREKWATIGDEDRSWHIHLNMDEVVQARFVKNQDQMQDKVTVLDSLIQKVICQCVQISPKCMIVMGDKGKGCQL